METASVLKVETTHVLVDANRQSYYVKKYDRHMLWIVCILYVLSYLDRGNIGNAKTAGAQDDLGLSSAQWTWVLNGFYICYTVFEWGTVLWKIFPAHIYVSIICLCWGVAAMSAGAAHNLAGLIAARCVLGVLEAGFGAGAPYYLSLFYQQKELGLRAALLTGMSPLANCFAASLAYGITHINGSLEPWRLLFLIEDEKYNSVRYFGIWLACCGVFPALSINITWLLNNQGGESKRGAGLAILAIFGQTSSFLSSAVFPKEDKPYFVKGCAIGCAFAGLICVLSLGLHFKLAHENKKRDATTGPIDPTEVLDVTQLRDKHPNFRYFT
ncbi:hypothetical protein VE03_08325 [Pseudogymnoascus sp. 23342-1-I1]|nr:hypothetical protein VE03_08325 [Pseudogymnoascus sp. 23342-1-I1]